MCISGSTSSLNLSGGEIIMTFLGVNAALIQQYIEFKRNLGYLMKRPCVLKMFDRFTIKNGINTIGLTRELAEKWAEKRPNESKRNRYSRINVIINFSAYLNQLGYDSYIPKKPKPCRSTFTPYIFSLSELQAFFYAADTTIVHKNSTMKYILPIIFRLIYSCGLRADEALSLKCADVCLDKQYIIIGNAKNGQDRILPLSDSITEICSLYQEKYLKRYSKNDYFFHQKNKMKYKTNSLYNWFRKVLWKSGISHGGRGLGPRVHDLRHSFSVHALHSMSQQGLDLYYSLPILSKYLGHRSLKATDQYVRLTSEMFPELIRDVDKNCTNVFPEVDEL